MNTTLTALRNASISNPVMVAKACSGPLCGAVVRLATSEETAAWLAQPARFPAFRKAIKVGDVLIDRHTGPGASHAGAGF